MYAASGHYYLQGCNNKLIKIKGEQKLQDEFYQRLSKITGENIIYPTNLSDDPFNYMSQQKLNDNIIVDENNNNLENENENNNSFDDSENLGLENAKSLKFMQQILDFFKNNTNAINEIRYTTKYMDSIFLANLPIDEYLDFSKYSEQGIYKNYKSGEQFKRIKNSISDKFILLRIFTDGMSHQGKSDYTIMIIMEMIMKLYQADYLLKEGNYRNQIDIIDFPNSKPNKQDFSNPENKFLKLGTEQKMKKIGITDYDRSWVENLKINYLYLQPDILHNILLGIVQWVLNYIFKKYKDNITIFTNNLKEVKMIPNHLPPSESLFSVKTRKGRENRSILYYILFITKSNVSNDDFLLLEEMVQLTFLLYQDSFDEDDLDKINYLVKTERFEAQFSKIKDLLSNNTNNQDKHKFERVTKILMATFLDNFNNLKEKEDDNNDLILGQKIKKDENIKFKNNIISDINLHYKNIKNIQFHKSIKNSKEIYNVGDGIEVASEHSVTGRWSAIIIAICLIELNNNKSVHSIYIQYFDKDKGDQNNKYHFLTKSISSIVFDNIVSTLIPIQIDSSNYLIIYKCHDQFLMSKKKK
ncbi:hypothetical protein ACTFIW_012074 [Dictyostelium discoideum]